ncbi:MAG: AgmX/PglI C-terminal domain-containing protein [Myxococcaceae bacterium]
MQTSTRVLRVALVQGGRIVEDRTFPPRTSVTVGSAPDCTFLVPMAEVPERATVFEASRRGGVSLVFDPGADGRVTTASFDRSLLELEATATRAGQRCVVPLDERSKGRIAVGEVSLLFQFVEPTAKPVPAELPKGARGLMAQVDRSFLVILGLSLAAHFAGLGWVSSQPVPVEQELSVDEQVDRFVAIKMPIPKPATPTAAPTTDTPKSTEETPKPQVAKRPVAVANNTTSLRERTNVGMVRLIGSAGGQDGAFGELLRDSAVGDVAKALDGATSVRVASVDDATATKQKGAEQGTTQTVELPGTSGLKRVELSDKELAKLDPKVKTEIVEVGGTEIPEDELSRWLNHRKAAVQSCYERELKRQPTLQGRVVIHFGVTPRGRVDHVGFSDDTLRSQAVQVCISNMMKGWVLPFTPEDEVPVSLPFIFSANR